SGCHRVFRDLQSGCLARVVARATGKKAIGGRKSGRPDKAVFPRSRLSRALPRDLAERMARWRRTWTADGDDRLGRDVAGSYDQRGSKPPGCALSAVATVAGGQQIARTSPLP